MFLPSSKHFVSFGRGIASRLLATTIGVSFFAMLVPIASASANKAGVMACCIGKEAGHCHARRGGNKSHHKAESSSQAVAESNAGAETKADTDANARVESASLSRPCPMDCGACTARTSRLQKRQKDVIQARTFHNSAPEAITCFEHLSRVFSANESWTHVNPRGPPATRL